MQQVPVNKAPLVEVPKLSSQVTAQDESFWERVRAEYSTPSADFTQLEFGWYHPCSHAVLARQVEAMQMGQHRGSHYKRGEMSSDRERTRTELARVAGVDREEVIVTRNTTESMNIVLQGMPLSTGDGIVYSDQDYPSVVQALQQRAARDGLELQMARVPLDPRSDDEVLKAFSAVITPRTRAILITHLINHTGHVLPVAKLCALGRTHGLQVIVDAAHSFAQLDFAVRDLDCDYLAASLHKWLGAPLGTGLLYVRRERIEEMTPFFADTTVGRKDIRKLEQFGNGPDSAYLGLEEAIRWHEWLGTTVKGARLHFLQRRWTEVARSLPSVRVLTPASPARHGAIGVFSIEGMTPTEVVKQLWDQHRIFVNAIEHSVVQGVRVTPGLPTSIAEIDRLVSAIRSIAEA